MQCFENLKDISNRLMGCFPGSQTEDLQTIRTELVVQRRQIQGFLGRHLERRRRRVERGEQEVRILLWC